ncbi:adenosylcobinamide-phosphate synthase CbiB [Desulfonatronovibrio magnus]|uniref:adenosylcobinamide-phosphate synthase CbiB n=1 Tax=Desulfonatronovibrio magnus TaxID=698827 RepID=UPI0005EB776F|nr:adenosylcobinamide-phosphate synthase CbiB [Desulfonatronovibrio magnus]
MFVNIIIFLLFCYIVDLIVGDPRSWPHPVKVLGKAINFIEHKCRITGFSLRKCGFIVLFLGVFLILFLVSLCISLPFFGLVISLYLGYASLALGCLIHETRKAQKLIAGKNIQQAREAVACLVSRDTEHLDQQGLYQALAESVSENYNDAFCAPFMYLSLLGVPWVWAYKFVSTLDSMWGYKVSHWKDLGYAAAKADDILAWIPARTGALSMLVASRILRLESSVSWSRIAGDARKTDSPNAGWTMSAAAHLLNVRMGGAASYFGKTRIKPEIGSGDNAYSKSKIDELINLIVLSSIIYAAFFTLIALIIS